jgi:hypothetical protein
MSEHNIHPTRPPAWLAIGATSHYRAPHAVTLCGASIPPNAITGTGLTRCPVCQAKWRERDAAKRALPCNCGLISKRHDPAACAKIRRNIRNILGKPPADIEGTHGYTGRNYAGHGAGYGETYRVPNSEMRRATVGIY